MVTKHKTLLVLLVVTIEGAGELVGRSSEARYEKKEATNKRNSLARQFSVWCAVMYCGGGGCT